MTLDEVKEYADKFKVLAEQVGGRIFHDLAAAFEKAAVVLEQQEAAAEAATEDKPAHAKPKHR